MYVRANHAPLNVRNVGTISLAGINREKVYILSSTVSPQNGRYMYRSVAT